MNLGNHNAINRWTYKINGRIYTLNICQPTTEAQNAGLVKGDRFTVNGRVYEFDGETAVSLDSLNARSERKRRNNKPDVKRQIQNMLEQRDIAGLEKIVATETDPATRRFAQDAINWF